jgi:hypothetical protein
MDRLKYKEEELEKLYKRKQKVSELQLFTWCKLNVKGIDYRGL